GDRRDSVVERDLVRVVATEVARGSTADGAGLRVADLRIGLAPGWVRAGFGVAEVALLCVEVRLGEAEVVREVVHSVVADEQVRHRGEDVVSPRCEVRRAALARLPDIRP